MMRLTGSIFFAMALLPALIIMGCGRSKPRTPVERGRLVYMIKCIQCHNRDPNTPGSKGPAIAGSSLELLKARVLTLKYPPGYKPQRTTRLMTAFPELKAKVPDLYAFLSAAKRNGSQRAKKPAGRAAPEDRGTPRQPSRDGKVSVK